MNIVDACRREWGRLGVPHDTAEEMAADLSADLAAAAEEGLSAEEYLGASAAHPRVLASEWASARGVVRPRWRVPLTVTAAVIGAVPGVSFALFAAYGLSSQAIGEILGHPARAGTTRPYADPYTPPTWLLLMLYVLGALFAYAGAVAAVGAALRATGDPATRETVRAMKVGVPLAVIASVAATVGFAASRDFSTAQRVVLAEVMVAGGLFALSVAGIRLFTVRRWAWRRTGNTPSGLAEGPVS
jgi:hypothetical protein